jgi:FkbM family methyltransferase
MRPIVDVERYARDVPETIADPWWRYDGAWEANAGRMYDWPLTEWSVVFDVGGGSGVWAKAMLEAYGCALFSFEPSPHYFDKMRAFVGPCPRYYPLPFGLGAEDRVLPLHDPERDGASFLNEEIGQSVPAEIRDVAGVSRELGAQPIDLMAVNVEGWEYELIPRLIETRLVRSIERLMIQWHTFNEPLYERLRYGIQTVLARTHQMTWNHMAYEAWESK